MMVIAGLAQSNSCLPVCVLLL